MAQFKNGDWAVMSDYWLFFFAAIGFGSFVFSALIIVFFFGWSIVNYFKELVQGKLDAP